MNALMEAKFEKGLMDWEVEASCPSCQDTFTAETADELDWECPDCLVGLRGEA